MKQILVIPDYENLDESLKIAAEYGLGFEYNDFFVPNLLDDEIELEKIVSCYQGKSLPIFTTLHGAFFDVIPFSMDAKIREIGHLRIEQSISVAKKMGANAVIFHTNYDPFLNTSEYIEYWLQANTEYWSSILEEHPDINIYLENMFDVSPAMLEILSENLFKYKNYGVCLDYAHASLSNVPPEVWAERLGKYVKHIHINDNNLVSDLHLAWGDGSIDRQKFYKTYETYLKEVPVLIETTSLENQMRSLSKLKEDGFC